MSRENSAPVVSIRPMKHGDLLPSGEQPVRMRYYVEYPSYPRGGIYDLFIDIALTGSRTEEDLPYLQAKMKYQYDIRPNIEMEWASDVMEYGFDYPKRLIYTIDGDFFGRRHASDEEIRIAEETVLPPNRRLTVLDCSTEDIEEDLKRLFSDVKETIEVTRINELLSNVTDPLGMRWDKQSITHPTTEYDTGSIAATWDTD